MEKKILLSFILVLNLSIFCFSQSEPIDVTELSLKVGGASTEEFYFGFAEGDKIVFNFLEEDNKPLKEVEVIEYPSSSKYMEYETKKIENKILNVSKKSIYKFRFHNSALGGRICKIKIQRIPAKEETKIFNTNIVWKTLYDTTYQTVQERYLVKRDTIFEKVCDQVAKVHSSTVMSGTPNKTIADFILPDNTVSWTYYIGVGEEGTKVYNEANQKFLKSTSKFVATLPPYGPLAALALEGISYFSAAQGGDNVQYYFISDAQSVENFMSGLEFLQYKRGDVINDHGKLTSPLRGRQYIALYNDNIQQGIDVNIKIVAVRVIEEYGVKDVKKANVTSRNVALNEE